MTDERLFKARDCPQCLLSHAQLRIAPKTALCPRCSDLELSSAKARPIQMHMPIQFAGDAAPASSNHTAQQQEMK